jgi:hypothetical protein
MSRTLLKLEEVAVLVGVSCQTLNNWYRFKRENPDNEYAKMLPDYECIGGHNQRFWDKSDINSLLKFKLFMPKGCKGVMGSVTQRYVRKESKNG